MAPRDKRPVVSQMPNPMKVSTTQAPGQYGHNNPPFDQPQSMGGGGVPTKFFDTTVPASVGRSTVSGSGIPASNLMSPAKYGPTRTAAKAKVPGNKK